jgi:protein tyrosine/serine phosphatase
VPLKILLAKIGVIALLLSAPFCLSAGAPPSEQPTSKESKHAMAARQEATGIHGFAEVTPKLYRGGQPSIVGIKALEKLGIDIVVNMRGGHNDAEEKQVNQLGMRYVSIPWHCPHPTDKPFAKFLKLVRENPGKKIFVHCRLGDDRTGMAVAAYRMSEEGWSAEEAMREMKAFGFSGSHHLICPTLAHYEHEFPEHLKSSDAFEELRQNRPSGQSK